MATFPMPVIPSLCFTMALARMLLLVLSVSMVPGDAFKTPPASLAIGGKVRAFGNSGSNASDSNGEAVPQDRSGVIAGSGIVEESERVTLIHTSQQLMRRLSLRPCGSTDPTQTAHSRSQPCVSNALGSTLVAGAPDVQQPSARPSIRRANPRQEQTQGTAGREASPGLGLSSDATRLEDFIHSGLEKCAGMVSEVRIFLVAFFMWIALMRTVLRKGDQNRDERKPLRSPGST